MAASRLLVLSVLFALGCGGPIVLLPGGELSGTAAEVPTSWGLPEVVQLETRPSDPYSVNIWAVGIDGAAYVATSEDAKWNAFIAADARVRVGFDEKLYELNALRVVDQAERAIVAAAYASKYDVDPADSQDAVVYRLDRR